MISDWLGENEIDALFRVIKSKRDRAIFKLLYFGLGLNEITRLRLADWNDSDYLRCPRVTVNRGRFGLWDHDLGWPPVANAVRSWIKIRGRAPGPLFTSRFSWSKKITRQQIVDLFRAYGEEVGLTEKADLRSFQRSGTYERLKDWR